MASHRFIVGTVLAAAVVAVAPLATPALASGEHDQRAPEPSSLVLTTTGMDGSRSVSLLCDPASGNHPAADQACQALTSAEGDFDKLSGGQDSMVCTMDYRPVTASAQGTWRGKPVSFRKEYPNACALRAKTGKVFEF
ncbi:subtilase-type protease inhibitor [Goodfellowiella coeruleoviolacea]|uniref:PEP-CTERM protein-sorting domain-containing protein n=1 Tax=Goodfellowiella coeruleoviolacea TaxID=334858 RepID=A0AAE3GGY9_9PSEU|nr:subtilase-type protease inhibitor [Goodfellowiella coeruleoviolacea]MCP2168056.1 PEP-CTERM protein-sorting domain-containing protein [Goodfellowiella coeruleoviolacea]